MEPDSSSYYQLSCNKSLFEINELKVERLAASILSILGLSEFLISVDFICPEDMRKLNLDHRGKNSSTDVLSFPQSDFPEPITVDRPHQNVLPTQDGPPLLLGDVVISLVDAQTNAYRIGQDLDREVCFLLVHGILHLCGHDHMNTEEEQVMFHQQKAIMSHLNDREPPPFIWSQCVRSKDNP